MPIQARTIDSVVVEQHLHVIKDFKLEGVTGSVPALRSDIAEILTLKEKQPDLRLLVVPDTSRFTRVGTNHGCKLLYELKAAGIFVYFVAEDITNDNDMAEFYLAFLFGAANQQAKSIARNATMGSERSFLDGKSAHCRAPAFGLDRMYLLDGKPQHVIRNQSDGTQLMLSPDGLRVTRSFGRNEKTGVPNHYIKQKTETVMLVPGDPVLVKIVQLIFFMRYIQNLGYHAIAKYLNDQGMASPSDGGWFTGTVRNICMSPVYLGVGIRNQRACGIYSISSGKGEPKRSEVTLKDIVDGMPKPMARPREEWLERPMPKLEGFLPEPVKAKAAAAIEKYHQQIADGKRPPADKNKHALSSTYILSKKLAAKQGGHAMTGRSMKNPQGKNYRRYAVSRANSVPKSNNVLAGTIAADPAEQAILSLIQQAVLSKEGLRDAIVSAVAAADADKTKLGNADQINKEITKRQKRIIALNRRLTADSLIDAPLEAEADRLHTEVRELTFQLRRVQQALPLKAKDVSANIDQLVADFAQHVQQIETKDPAAAKALVNLLVGRMEADLVTKEIEVELSVPQSLGHLLKTEPKVCLVSALACEPLHETHRENRLKIEVYRCRIERVARNRCYQCRRASTAA